MKSNHNRVATLAIISYMWTKKKKTFTNKVDIFIMIWVKWQNSPSRAVAAGCKTDSVLHFLLFHVCFYDSFNFIILFCTYLFAVAFTQSFQSQYTASYLDKLALAIIQVFTQ